MSFNMKSIIYNQTHFLEASSFRPKSVLLFNNQTYSQVVQDEQITHKLNTSKKIFLRFGLVDSFCWKIDLDSRVKFYLIFFFIFFYKDWVIYIYLFIFFIDKKK